MINNKSFKINKIFNKISIRIYLPKDFFILKAIMLKNVFFLILSL